MRLFLSLCTLVALSFVVAAPSSACQVSSAKVVGTFNEEGQFVVAGAMDQEGNALPVSGEAVLANVTTAEDVTLNPASFTGKTVYVVGDVDFDQSALHIASFTGCSATASACLQKIRSAESATAAVATAAAPAGGAGCCAAKAASAKAAQADAATAHAVTTNAKGCGSGKAAAASASCSASKAKAASAATAADAHGVTSNAKSCGSRKAAQSTSVETAAAADARLIVFNVSGLTCGGCCSKVESAIAGLKLENIASCAVNLDQNKAVVTVTGAVEPAMLQKAIVEAGFGAELNEDETTAI